MEPQYSSERVSFFITARCPSLGWITGGNDRFISVASLWRLTGGVSRSRRQCFKSYSFGSSVMCECVGWFRLRNHAVRATKSGAAFLVSRTRASGIDSPGLASGCRIGGGSERCANHLVEATRLASHHRRGHLCGTDCRVDRCCRSEQQSAPKDRQGRGTSRHRRPEESTSPWVPTHLLIPSLASAFPLTALSMQRTSGSLCEIEGGWMSVYKRLNVLEYERY